MIWLGYNHNQGRGVMDKKLIRRITWVGKALQGLYWQGVTGAAAISPGQPLQGTRS
ncbi:hypothetical protein ES703_113773 [subsurface metagenome]